MIEQATRLMVHSGASWVLGLLIGLSLVSAAIAIDRALVCRRAAGNISELVPLLRRLLRANEPAAALRLLASNSASVPGRVVIAGLEEADRGPAAAEEAMAAAIGLERKRLGKRLLFLGTVGNNAPFIGLLGTVIGVVGAFEELSRPRALAGAWPPPPRSLPKA